MIDAVENGGDPSEFFAEPLKRVQGKQSSAKQAKGATVRTTTTTNGSRPSVTKNRFVSSKDRAMSPVNTSKKSSPTKAPQIKPKAVRKTEPDEDEAIEAEIIKKSRKEIREESPEEEKEMPIEAHVSQTYEDEEIVDEDNKPNLKDLFQKEIQSSEKKEEPHSEPKIKEQVIEKQTKEEKHSKITEEQHEQKIEKSHNDKEMIIKPEIENKQHHDNKAEHEEAKEKPKMHKENLDHEVKEHHEVSEHKDVEHHDKQSIDKTPEVQHHEEKKEHHEDKNVHHEEKKEHKEEKKEHKEEKKEHKEEKIEHKEEKKDHKEEQIFKAVETKHVEKVEEKHQDPVHHVDLIKPLEMPKGNNIQDIEQKQPATSNIQDHQQENEEVVYNLIQFILN